MMRHARSILVTIVILVLFAAPKTADAYWPMFQKDPMHSGVTQHDGAESNSIAWDYNTKPSGWTGDAIWASPIINPAGDRVYMAALFGRLYCFDLADGDSLWARDLPEGITATPALANGYLYVVARGDSSLYCLDAADGDSIWATKLGDTWWDVTGVSSWMESSPIVVGDSVLYVGSLDGTVYCLYTNNGAVKWQSGLLGDYIVSSPAYHAERIYIGATGGLWSAEASGVYCLDAADGDTIWYYTYETGNIGGTMSSPMIANGRVYIGMNNNWNESAPPNGGSLSYFMESRDEPPAPYQLDNPDWTYGIDCDVRGTPVCTGGLVYVTSGRGLYAFDAYGGDAPVYGVDHGAGVLLGEGLETYSSFAVSDRFTVAEREMMLFVGDGGIGSGEGIYCLSKNLEVLWHGVTDCRVWGSPAIANGKVVIGANDGMVYCFVDDSQGDRIVSPTGTIAYPDYRGRRPPLEVGTSTAAIGEGFATQIESNPFERRAQIRFLLPPGIRGPIDLSVVDIAGRRVRDLILPHSITGTTVVEWDGRDARGAKAEAGIYLLLLRTERFSRATRLVLCP